MKKEVMDNEKKRNKKKGIDFDINNKEYNLNEAIKFKIGTIDDKFFPGTVYLQMSFWFDLNKENILEDFETEVSFNRYFRRKLNEMFLTNISPKIKHSTLFPLYDSNIFAYDIPHNVVYSKKRCFCSIELTLHTSNVFKKEKEFSDNNNSEIFTSLIDISKTFSDSEFFDTSKYYNVHNRK